jgi:ADP-dependent NAD(P)H-hydrate dehydratase / NAD(P)H-hydrate epimerase
MQKVLTAAQMREVDRLTTERFGIPSIILMENAAQAVARVITDELGGSVRDKSIVILCGPGNNGGDGAALARILSLNGANVDTLLLGKVEETRGDARVNFGVLSREDFSFETVFTSTSFGILREISSVDEWYDFYGHTGHFADVIVDAIFGTGVTRPLEGWVANVVHALNFANEGPTPNPRICVSVDIPSGLNADLGYPIGEPIKADVTVTFTAPKPANVLPGTAAFNRRLLIADIGSPEELIDDLPSQLFLAERSDICEWIDSTDFTDASYKNKRGHALIIAGSRNYSGAAVLAGNAGIRSGVGLITLAVPEDSRHGVIGRVSPEVMVRGIIQTKTGSAAEGAANEIQDFLANVDAVAIGSGLSAKEDETKALVRRMVEGRRTPMIIDADALTALAPWKIKGSDKFPLVLTPHEGEFKRLLGVEGEGAKEALRDRVAAVREFATKYNVILLLKGERILMGHPDGRVVVNPTGNSGLGKAGNGDTLTGILAGFVAQAVQMNIDIFETVVAAVYIAGMAGDEAERKFGKRVMTATDVRDCLADVFRSLQ